MNGPMYVEQLDYLAKVTRVLNEHMPDVSNDVGYYVHVELREQDTHKVVGQWSDEIAGDCWSYDAVRKAVSS